MPMSGTSTTTTPGMHQAATYLGNTQSIARAGVNQVDQELSLLRSTWTGEASRTFHRSMDGWVSDCNYIIGKLGEMIEVMNGNRRVITNGEAYNNDLAARMPVGPGLEGL
ncbi:WXG100 family type VII secretion target [Lentzea sp. NPDC004782]|uniref:WXG100 family type VII secretion target n=1 Tax=Lentzea sp. NPDC004782 TaxID=3154458 RepID=UPI0033A45B49